MKIKLPTQNKAVRILSIRFTDQEYKMIVDKAQSSGVKPSTLVRIAMAQILPNLEIN